MAKAKSNYVVIYRTGGTDNFKWQPAIPVATYDEARAQRDDIERGGRPAYIYTVRQFEVIGVPETFKPGGDLLAVSNALYAEHEPEEVARAAANCCNHPELHTAR